MGAMKLVTTLAGWIWRMLSFISAQWPWSHSKTISDASHLIDDKPTARPAELVTNKHSTETACSQATYPSSVLCAGTSKGPILYTSPVKRTRVSIKVEGFEPFQIAPAFPERMQTQLRVHGKLVTGVTMWSGCIEVALDLCDDSDDSCYSQNNLWGGYDGGDQDGRDAAQMHSAADTDVLQALLASCQVPFQAGQKVWAQVGDRQYIIVCVSGGARATWTFQLQGEQGDAASLLSDPLFRADASRPLYIAPMCVLLDRSVMDVPQQVEVGGRGLSEHADFRFAALVGGEHLPCAQTIMGATVTRHSSARGGDAMSSGARSASAIDSWVHVEVPALPRHTPPGLMHLECRDARSVAAPSVLGVLPVLLLDDAPMAREVGQLQREARQYADEGAADSLASVYCLITDLAHWLQWVDEGQSHVIARFGHAHQHGGVGVPSAPTAMMGAMAHALLQAALLRGWEHTAARILGAMSDLGIPRSAPVAAAAVVSEMGSRTSSSLLQSFRQSLLATTGTSRRNGKAPVSQAAVSREELTQENGGSEGHSHESADGGGAAGSSSGVMATNTSHRTVLRSIAFGFEAPGDEARYVDYVSHAFLPVAQSWLCCGVLLFCVWSCYSIVQRRLYYLLVVVPLNSGPGLLAAWCCFGFPQRWRTWREAVWMGCFVGRMVSRLTIWAGDAVQTDGARAFMERYGDLLAGVILPQSAEWVRERYMVWLQLLDIVINTTVYRRIGLHDGALLACLCHALLKMALGVAINVAIEYWTRRSFLQAVQRKRQ